MAKAEDVAVMNEMVMLVDAARMRTARKSVAK